MGDKKDDPTFEKLVAFIIEFNPDLTQEQVLRMEFPELRASVERINQRPEAIYAASTAEADAWDNLLAASRELLRMDPKLTEAQFEEMTLGGIFAELERLGAQGTLARFRSALSRVSNARERSLLAKPTKGGIQ